MSLLADHFARVEALRAQGLPVIRGVFFDVVGTIDRGELNEPLIAFAAWNNRHKMLGDNCVFSTDADYSRKILKEKNFDFTIFGGEEIAFKQRTYNEAFNMHCSDNLGLRNALCEEDRPNFAPRQSHCLELVIDDSAPYKEGIKGLPLVVTWWNPDDAAVQAFLQNKEYENFMQP